ncbi:MAG: TetR/AcrR family transcriptional regulator [Proteobacteria bacterium]|nr:TetR/AcrR family transcriptional regulator [Pseudomonadota bacterium]
MTDKRRERGEKTKQAILTATEEILDTKGGKALSTRAIAQKAGISQSNLYHHFNGIEEILFACLREKAQQALKVEHTKEFKTLHDYLANLIEISVNSLQSLQSLSFSIKEKAHYDEEFRIRLITLGQEFINNLKTNIKAIFGNNVDEKQLDFIVFAYTMFREGFIAHSQLFLDASPFDNATDKCRDVLQLFSRHLYEPRPTLKEQYNNDF